MYEWQMSSRLQVPSSRLAVTSREERKAGPGIHFNKQAVLCVWYSTSIVVIASRRNYMVQ